MKLVDDWRDWTRWWSMRWLILTTASAAVIAAYNTLPADWLPEIAPWVKKAVGYVTLGSGGAAAISRVTKQKGLRRRYTDHHEDRRAPTNPGKTPCAEPPKDSLP